MAHSAWLLNGQMEHEKEGERQRKRDNGSIYVVFHFISPVKFYKINITIYTKLGPPYLACTFLFSAVMCSLISDCICMYILEIFVHVFACIKSGRIDLKSVV